MPTATVSPYTVGSNSALGSCTISGAGANATIAFNNARGASSGVVNQSATASPNSIQLSQNVGGRGVTITISRSFAWFDVSAYASSTSINTISAITLKTLSGGVSGVTTDYVVAKSVNAFSSATSTTLASGDYNSVFFNTLYSSTGLSWAAAATSVNAVLNTSAINDANTNGKLNIVWLNYTYDQQNAAPTTFFSFTGINNIDQINVSKTALSVTYAPAGYGNEVNTVASGDIDSINNVASGAIDTVNTA